MRIVRRVRVNYSEKMELWNESFAKGKKDKMNDGGASLGLEHSIAATCLGHKSSSPRRIKGEMAALVWEPGGESGHRSPVKRKMF